MIKLFPIVLTRLAGLDYESLKPIFESKSANVADKIIKINQQNRRLVEQNELSKELLVGLKRIKDQTTRMKVYNIRRKIFNHKSLNRDEIFALTSTIKTKTILKYIKNLESIDVLRDFGVAQYNKDKNCQIEILRKILINDKFQLGILQSSSSLFASLGIYLNKGIEDLTKKDKRTQYSALRYVTRMATKTSPLSTFGKVTLGRIQKTNHYLITANRYQINRKNKNVRQIKLNNYIYFQLLELLNTELYIKTNRSVMVNPALEITADRICRYFIYEHGQEVFKRIAKGAEIIKIIELFNENAEQEYGKLLNLSSKSYNIDKKAATKIIDTLIDNGLLIFKQVTPFNKNWEEQLLQNIKSWQTPNRIVECVNHILNTYKKEKETLEKNNVSQRHEAVKDISSKLKDILHNRGSRNGSAYDKIPKLGIYSLNPENILYEDEYENQTVLLNEKPLSEIVSSATFLARYLYPNNPLFRKRIGLYELFKSKHPNIRNISLTEFYEDYLRHLSLTPDSNTTDKDIALEFDEKLTNMLMRKLEGSEGDINITKDDLALNFRNTTYSIMPLENVSLSCFLQLTQIDNTVVGILGKEPVIHSGYGKFASRFLTGFPSRVTTQFRKLNKSFIGPLEIFAEFNDYSSFNANSHPLLMPNELAIPNSINFSDNRKNKILIKDISIIPDDKNKVLILIHNPTNKKVNLFDLGFQSTNTRSKFFQFLFILSKMEIIPINVFGRIANILEGNQSGKKEAILVHRRIVFSGNLVLRRKGWTISANIIPKRVDFLSEWEYFLAIRSWVSCEMLPNNVFVYVGGSNKQIEAKNIRRAEHKPQFVCFSSIAYVQLFEKIVRSSEEYIYVEELLPNEDDLVDFNNRKYVTEHLIHWQTLPV